MPSTPKRQHQVSRGYLNRFGIDESVLVRRRDGKVFETSTLNVAVESGFYDVPTSQGRKSTAVEQMLAQVDDLALKRLNDIDRTGVPPAADTQERAEFAGVLALQLLRTTDKREQLLFPSRVSEFAAGREVSVELVADFLEHKYLGFRPRKNEAEAAWIYVTQWLNGMDMDDKAFALKMMLQTVELYVPRLLSMAWAVEVDRKERFITSDVPAVRWRTPSHRDNFEGMGLDKAEEVRFPLDPSKQLVLSRRARTASMRITSERVAACNQDMADGCHRFVVGRRDQGALIANLHLTSRRPVMRFAMGPLSVMGADGRKVRESEVIQMWVPRRPLDH